LARWRLTQDGVKAPTWLERQLPDEAPPADIVGEVYVRLLGATNDRPVRRVRKYLAAVAHRSRTQRSGENPAVVDREVRCGSMVPTIGD